MSKSRAVNNGATMSMVVDLDDYVSTPQAAEILGIKYPALWARIDRGQIQTLRVGRVHLIKRSELLGSTDNDNPEGMGEAAG